MRRSIATRGAGAALLGCAAVIACLALSSASALGAEPCPSEESLLPASGDLPFICAQMEHSGKKSLNPGETKTWSKSIATDPTYYDIQTHCEHPNDKNVTVSWAGAVSSYSATGTNWGTGDHSFGAGVLFVLHKSGVSVDKDGYKGGCTNDDGNAKEGRITNSIEQRTEYGKLVSGYEQGYAGVPMHIEAQVSPSNTAGQCLFEPIPDTSPQQYELISGCVLLFLDNTSPKEGDAPVAFGTLNNGTADLTWTPTDADAATGTPIGYHKLTVTYAEDTYSCPSDNGTCGYSPTEPKTYDTYIQPAPGSAAASATDPAAQKRVALTEPSGNSATSASRSARLPNFHLATKTKRRRMPARLALRCPRGDVLMYAETLTRGEAPLAYSRHRVRVRSHEMHKGRRVAVQITCRARSARLRLSRRLGVGTPHADRIATRAHGAATAFGGPGDDRIRLRGPNGVGNGGLGADRIAATSRNDVANGGPGDDLLVSLARGRTLLVGGPGHDTLVGSHGRTIINAKDDGRDRVVCRSTRNRVLVDRHDVVHGPCRPHRHL